MTPLEAVTAADPYPFYESLLREKPLYLDKGLSLWVASDAASVKHILNEPAFGVRPQAESIPNALKDLQSGAIFGSLMRMTDGSRQCPLKAAALEAVDGDCTKECHRLASHWATALTERPEDTSSLDAVRRLMFLLPTFAIGSCLGVPSDALHSLAVEVSAFVVGISPIATVEQRVLGGSAAQTLSDRVGRLFRDQASAGVLLRTFAAACAQHSVDAEDCGE